MAKYLLFLIAVTIAGCTNTSIEPQPGSERRVAEATAACFGLCPPDREDLMAAMHRQCQWPSVPAIHVRGSEKNGLLGVPHAVWRFSCLTVSPATDLANRGSGAP